MLEEGSLPTLASPPAAGCSCLLLPVRLEVGLGFSWCSLVLGRPCLFWVVEVGPSQHSCSTLHGSRTLPGMCKGSWQESFLVLPQWWQTSAYVSAGSWAEWISCSFPRDSLVLLSTQRKSCDGEGWGGVLPPQMTCFIYHPPNN